ncbi:MAG: cupin domain-containing protein [Bacteroidia bacterium]
MRKEDLIRQFQLLPHPEGGYYRETWRSTEKVATTRGSRSAGTTIYFLLESGNFSAFHRLQSDEAWYFHLGSAVNIYLIYPDGEAATIQLGSDLNHQHLQVILPAGTWFAAETIQSNSYTLVSCSVSPGFEFQDFELADKEELAAQYPDHRQLIERFCR